MLAILSTVTIPTVSHIFTHSTMFRDKRDGVVLSFTMSFHISFPRCKFCHLCLLLCLLAPAWLSVEMKNDRDIHLLHQW